MLVFKQKFLHQTALATAILCAVSAFTAIPAHAETNTDDVLTTSEVSSALDKAGSLVQDALPSVTTSSEAAVSTTGNVTVEVPKDLTSGVDLTGTGLDLTIHLPNANDAAKGVKNSDGQVIYSSQEASANTVIPTEGGVQMLTTIANSSAPERYTYEVETAPGDYFQIQEDGSAILYAADGSLKLAVATPWATDANGQNIPTHYETDGTSLTQVIEHSTAQGIAYPVVADPVIFAIAGIAIAIAAVIGIGVVVWWFNYCRGMNMWPSVDTTRGYTIRCVR
ncbi:hypothetical protein [Aurantimicrobium minutum]|uniref:hypothetical protein n=1 Tax=Aurantimicrobium minutum TaxID=708131 RepID=UPI002476058F|nr:hypothetical protein [Aurantimicrobium minutum]